MTVHVVRCEQDAWRLLERCLSEDGVGLDGDRAAFKGWPHLIVKTDPGDGSVTPEMMRAHLRVQQAAYRGFALLKYGTADVRRLTTQERHVLKLNLAVEKGSSIFKIDLAPALKKCLQAAFANMTGAQAMCTVLGLGLIMCSPVTYGTWLYFQGQIRQEQIRMKGQLALAERQVTADLRREEIHSQRQRELLTEVRAVSDNSITQMQLLKAAYDRSDLIRYAATDYIPWRPALMEVAPYTGTITINGVTLDSAVAKKMAKITKANARTISTKRKAIPPSGSKVIEAPWITTVTVDHPALPQPPMRLGRTTPT